MLISISSVFIFSIFLFGTKTSIPLGDAHHYTHFFHCLSDIYKTNNMISFDSSTHLTSLPVYERPMTEPVQFEDLRLQFDPSTIATAENVTRQGVAYTAPSTHRGQEDVMRTAMAEMTQSPSRMTLLRILLSDKQLGSLRDGITARRALQALRSRGQVETCPDGDRWQDDKLRLSKNDCLTATLAVAVNLSQSRMCMTQTPSGDSDSTTAPIQSQIDQVGTVLNVSAYVHL
jgi:hypothetical protein